MQDNGLNAVSSQVGSDELAWQFSQLGATNSNLPASGLLIAKQVMWESSW